MHGSMGDVKSHFKAPAAPFYQYTDRESTLSLANLSKKDKKSANVGVSAAAQSLFFSPTAGAGAGGQPGNRASSYLPAGYYSAGASQPGGGAGMMHMGGDRSISLSNLGPPMQGYARARDVGPSPPDSPGFGAQGARENPSQLNLNAPGGGQGRTPSAYLEDMMDGTDPRARY
jgi:hypothetical protein